MKFVSNKFAKCKSINQLTYNFSRQSSVSREASSWLSIKIFSAFFALLAQLEERWPSKLTAIGSSPVRCNFCKD